VDEYGRGEYEQDEYERGVVRLDTLLEHTHEAYVAIDAGGIVRAWNPEAERTFGWSHDAAVGSVLRDLIIPHRFRERHDAGLLRFVETGEGPLVGRRIEIAALHRSGNEFPVELTISAIRTGDGLTFHAFVHDISDRYRAVELQARLAAVVEHSIDAVITRARDGTITTWNPGAERLLGWSAGEMLGKRADLLQRALAGEGIASFETVRLHKDGRRVDVSLTLSPIRDDGGTVNEVAMIARDIGGRRSAERALADALDLKTRFVATASHELRTPLTSISGFTSTLLKQWNELDDDRKLEFLRIVDEQARRLQRLVEDVLLVSRIEAGAVATGADGAAAADLADVTRLVVTELAPREQISIAVSGDPHAAVARDTAHRIVLNYVANALAYGLPPVSIEILCEEGFVRLTVADAGPGVPEESIAQLFTAFTQTTPVSARGTGLGLAIVRGLTESAGGDAWYEPGLPGGARFSVSLPRAPS